MVIQNLPPSMTGFPSAREGQTSYCIILAEASKASSLNKLSLVEGQVSAVQQSVLFPLVEGG